MDIDTKRRRKMTLQENIELIESLFEYPPGYDRDKANLAILEDDKETMAKLKSDILKCKAKKDRIIASLEAAKSPKERDEIMCSVNLNLDE